jgi:hypothetical protein
MQEVFKNEIASLNKEGVKKEVLKKIEDFFGTMVKNKTVLVIEKALYGIRKKLEDLNKVDPQQANIIQEYLKEMVDSSSQVEIKKDIERLKEYLNQTKGKSENKVEKVKDGGSWQIYILPQRMVIPIGANISLRTIVIYNTMFIKEVGPELGWFSSKPDIAFVDGNGVVHALIKGETRIKARYKGEESPPAEVIVVDKMDEQADRSVTQELRR